MRLHPEPPPPRLTSSSELVDRQDLEQKLEPQEAAEWYYVGRYGELGPLTLSQMQDLAMDGVISSDTFVWKQGMAEWKPASSMSDLSTRLGAELTPPPPPMPVVDARTIAPTAPRFEPTYHHHRIEDSPLSRSRAGLLNLIPGVGRLYLGYSAIGVLQLVTFLVCGVGFIWAVIDSIYILTGGLKHDGYGRPLKD